MTTPAGVMTMRAMALVMSADLPAKALVLEMKNHNRQHACPLCESKGATLPGDHLHRYWPADLNPIALMKP